MGGPTSAMGSSNIWTQIRPHCTCPDCPVICREQKWGGKVCWKDAEREAALNTGRCTHLWNESPPLIILQLSLFFWFQSCIREAHKHKSGWIFGDFSSLFYRVFWPNPPEFFEQCPMGHIIFEFGKTRVLLRGREHCQRRGQVKVNGGKVELERMRCRWGEEPLLTEAAEPRCELFCSLERCTNWTIFQLQQELFTL